jgi:hypothetical protein
MPYDSGPIGLDEERKRNRLLKFDPQINAGHILQIVVLVAGIFSAYNTLDKRQSIADIRMEGIEHRAREQDQRLRETLSNIQAELKDTRRTVEEVNIAVKTQIKTQQMQAPR